MVKMAEHGVRLAQSLEVDGVGVGQQQQAIACGQTCEHRLGDQRLRKDRVPNLAEAIVIDGEIEYGRHPRHEIARLDQAGLELLHQAAAGKALGYLGRGVWAKSFKRPVTALEVEIDQHEEEI